MIPGALLRWGESPVTREVDHDRCLREMCDYGAQQVRAGEADVIEFSVMPTEVAMIRAYMAEQHPGVRFWCSYPAWGQEFVKKAGGS